MRIPSGAQQDLQFQVEEYLRGKGWKHTSSTGPGCYWMWLRQMPAEVATEAVPAGSLILVDFETAVRMQKSWEAWVADLAAPDDEEGPAGDDDEPAEERSELDELEAELDADDEFMDDGLCSPMPQREGGRE